VTPVKGVDILTEGFLRVPGVDLRLKIFGVAASEKSLAGLNAKLESLARRDDRIELRPALPLQEVVGAYRELDLLAIPSITLETGPLVLFEALSMGVPVFGSSRLGHPSLLASCGMVVEPNSPAGWQAALEVAAREFRAGNWDERVARVRANANLKTMDDVAREMLQQYAKASSGVSGP
jgi:glycosyltransferase involved in cell wall biosynthesis